MAIILYKNKETKNKKEYNKKIYISASKNTQLPNHNVEFNSRLSVLYHEFVIF